MNRHVVESAAGGLKAGQSRVDHRRDVCAHPSPCQRGPTPAPPPACRLGAAQAGFSLIEVVVAALIVVLLGAATARALIVTTHVSGDERLRSQADTLATQDQERLRSLTDQQLSQLSTGSSHTVTVGGTTFTITSTSTFVGAGGTSGCSSPGATYYRTVSTVSWNEVYTNRTGVNVSEQSLLSRPVSGDMEATVQDQTTTAALPGVNAAASGPTAQTASTDVNGCVLFAGLLPGAYTVSFTDPGYVSPNGATTQTGTATVSQTGIAQVSGAPFYFGLAGSVNATFATPGGIAGQADGLSWLGTGGSLSMTTPGTTSVSTAAPTLSTGSLFPFDGSTTGYTNNYAIWAGQCLQQEPPTGYDQFSVSPGSTGTSQTIQEPLLDVNSVLYQTRTGSTQVQPTAVVLYFASTQGTSCSDQWAASVASSLNSTTGWLASPGQPFASTATSGSLASGASGTSHAEAGTLTVCASYGGYHGSVTATNSNMTAPNVVPAITINSTSNANLGACPAPT